MWEDEEEWTWANKTLLPYLGDELREPPSFHDEMEKRLKMDF